MDGISYMRDETRQRWWMHVSCRTPWLFSHLPELSSLRIQSFLSLPPCAPDESIPFFFALYPIALLSAPSCFSVNLKTWAFSPAHSGYFRGRWSVIRFSVCSLKHARGDYHVEMTQHCHVLYPKLLFQTWWFVTYLYRCNERPLRAYNMLETIVDITSESLLTVTWVLDFSVFKSGIMNLGHMAIVNNLTCITILHLQDSFIHNSLNYKSPQIQLQDPRVTEMAEKLYPVITVV